LSVRTSGDGDGGTLRVTGRWWLAGREENVVGGVLTLHDGDPYELTLSGELGDEATYGPQTIFGSGDTVSFVSLHSAYWRSTSENEATTVQKWEGHSFLASSRFIQDDETYQRAQLVTASAADWLDTPRASTFFPDDDSTTWGLKVEVPPDQFTDVDGLGRVGITWAITTRHGLNSSITLEPTFVLECSEPMTRGQIWERFVTPALLFVCVGSGGGDRIRSVSLTPAGTGNEARFARADWRTPVWRGQVPPEQRKKVSFYHPVRYRENLKLIPVHLQRWFALYGEVRAALLTFLLPRLDEPETYEEARFARAVQAIETYHRLHVGGTYFPDAEYDDILRRALGSLNAPERAFMRMRLAHSNEPTLSQRIRELAEVAGDPVGDLILSTRGFVSLVTTTRNEWVHEARIERGFARVPLVYATRALEYLFETLLYREMGLGDADVLDVLHRDPDWRWIRDNVAESCGKPG